MRGKHMQCDRHGRLAWKFTIMCGGCGKVYQVVAHGTKFEPVCKGAVPAPERCECGKRLPPEQGVQGGGIYWARPVCTECFTEKVAADEAQKHKWEASAPIIAPPLVLRHTEEEKRGSGIMVCDDKKPS